MHPGWVDRLRLAKEQGDFLYVGLWDDEMTKYYRGEDYPIQTLQERVLEVLACKYVDEVVIGAPFIMTHDLLRTLNVQTVVAFTTEEDSVLPIHQEVDPFAVARELGILVTIPKFDDDLTLEMIAERVYKQKAEFEAKFARKTNSEQNYYENKTYVTEASPNKE
jgi:ethanolamine-phosphate cytidylyltransferase